MIKNSFIYVISEFFNKGILFLLIPILTSYLSPYDYGLIASFTLFTAFILVFIELSVAGSIQVNFFTYSTSHIRRYIFNALFLILTGFIFILLSLFLFGNFISDQLDIPILWLYLGVLMVFFQAITQINLTLWVCEKKSMHFGVYQILQTLSQACIVVLLVVALSYNWEGQVIAMIGSFSLFGIISFYLIFKRRYCNFVLSLSDIYELLNFCLPTIPHRLSGWVKDHGDKFLIITFVSTSAAGIYTVGYQFAMIMGIIGLSLNRAWTPVFFEKLSQTLTKEIKTTIVKYTYVYILFIVIIVLLLNEVFNFVMLYWVNRQFEGALYYVIFILIKFGIDSINMVLSNYLYYLKKTKTIAIISVVTASIHFLSSYALIDIYGLASIVYSGIFSSLIALVLIWYVSNKYFPMPWLYFLRN